MLLEDCAVWILKSLLGECACGSVVKLSTGWEAEAQGSVNDFHSKKPRSFNLMSWEWRLSVFLKEEGGDKDSLKAAIRNISHQVTYLPPSPMVCKAREGEQPPPKRAAGKHGHWGENKKIKGILTERLRYKNVYLWLAMSSRGQVKVCQEMVNVWPGE